MSALILEGPEVLRRSQIAWGNASEPVPTFYPYHDNAHLYICDWLRAWRPVLTDEQKAFIIFEMYTAAWNFKRFGSGNTMSHDECLGVFFYLWYLGRQDLAREFLIKMKEHGGVMSAGEFSVFRIVDLEAIGESAAGFTPSPLLQLAYSTRILARCFSKYDGNGSSFNRAWISIPLMSSHPISALAITIFQVVMTFRGITPSRNFTQYFSKIPELAEQTKGKSFIDA